VSTGSNAFAEAAARADDPATAGEVLERAADYFRLIVTERLGLWKPVFETLLDAEGEPVLFHCTAGKDRTGFMAAALLKFLDADDELVFEDFELSTHVRRPWAEERLEFHRQRVAAEQGIDAGQVASESLDAWWSLMTAPPEFLRSTFAAVDETFGDWHTMRREGLGISDDRLAAWRSQIVE
jgi:protein-tyrosine phosphatase